MGSISYWRCNNEFLQNYGALTLSHFTSKKNAIIWLVKFFVLKNHRNLIDHFYFKNWAVTSCQKCWQAPLARFVWRANHIMHFCAHAACLCHVKYFCVNILLRVCVMTRNRMFCLADVVSLRNLVQLDWPIVL